MSAQWHGARRRARCQAPLFCGPLSAQLSAQLLPPPDVPPWPPDVGLRERDEVPAPRRLEDVFARLGEDFARLAEERVEDVLRAPLFVVEPEPSPELLAVDDRLRADAVPALLAAADRLAAAGRDADEERELPVDPDEDARAVLLDPELDRPPLLGAPDNIRCAASATASAISEPSLVALLMTELAALLAVSAASSPASRILRRALGLALIAAAAAASPAASISLLIAALASLSSVSLPVAEERRCAEPPLLLPDWPVAPLWSGWPLRC